MEKTDRKFYMMWGLAIILLAVAGALWLYGQGALSWLVLFGGIGIALIIVAEGDNTKFYGGIVFLLIGVMMFGLLSGANLVLVIIALAVVVGALVMWHGFRGGEK